MSDESFSLEPDPRPPEPSVAPPPAAVPPPPPVAAPEPAAAPGPTVVGQPPSSAPDATESPAADAWSLPVRRKVLAWLGNKGVGPATLVVLAVGVAVVSALCLAIDHPGFGALLGLAATGVAWLARTPPAEDAEDPAQPFVHAISEVVVAIIVGGFVLAEASVPAHAFVRIALLAGLLLLPFFRHVDRGRNLPSGPVVLSWAERLALLLVGTILGNPALIAFLLLGIVVADLLVRLTMIRPRSALDPALPPGLAACFRSDGSLLPPIRWSLLAISTLLCVVFGTEDGWRF